MGNFHPAGLNVRTRVEGILGSETETKTETKIVVTNLMMTTKALSPLSSSAVRQADNNNK